MTQVVYVKEYRESSAAIRLGDPIYKQSRDDERIRIGVAPNWLLLVPIIGLALWLVIEK